MLKTRRRTTNLASAVWGGKKIVLWAVRLRATLTVLLLGAGAWMKPQYRPGHQTHAHTVAGILVHWGVGNGKSPKVIRNKSQHTINIYRFTGGHQPGHVSDQWYCSRVSFFFFTILGRSPPMVGSWVFFYTRLCCAPACERNGIKKIIVCMYNGTWSRGFLRLHRLFFFSFSTFFERLSCLSCWLHVHTVALRNVWCEFSLPHARKRTLTLLCVVGWKLMCYVVRRFPSAQVARKESGNNNICWKE